MSSGWWGAGARLALESSLQYRGKQTRIESTYGFEHDDGDDDDEDDNEDEDDGSCGSGGLS